MRRRRPAGAAATLGLLAALPLAALEPDREPWQYARRSWGVREGLPSASVAALAQTPDGALWIGTLAGLARLDGVELRSFDRGTTPELPQNEIRALHVDRRGTLWIGTVSGLARLRDGRFEIVGLRGETVTSFAEAPDGSLVAVSSGGLARVPVDGAPARISLAAPWASRRPVQVAFDGDGSLWVGFVGGRLARLGAGDGVVDERTLPDAGERAGVGMGRRPDGSVVAVADGGRIWAVGASGLEPLAGGPPACGGRFQVGRTGALWCPWQTEHRVVRWRDGIRTSFEADSGLLGSEPITVLEDRDGSVWIGTWDGGVSRFSDAAFVTHSTRDGLPSDSVRTVLATRDGTVWAGTAGGVASLAPGERRWSAVPELAGARVGALAETPDGAVLAASSLGFHRLRIGRGERVEALDWPDPATAVSLFFDAHGALWWSGDGKIRHAPGLERRREARRTSLEALVFDWLEDPAGELWMGAHGGLYRQRPDEPLARVRTAFDPSYEVVFSLHRDARGDLWAGTLGGGLGLLRDGRWYRFGVAEGLPDDTANAVLEDSRGGLWIGSGRGVYRLALDDVDAFLAGERPRLRPRRFDLEDGLATLEGFGGARPAAMRDARGRLWFTTAAGLSMVDPERLPAELPPPAVRLVGVELEGARRPPVERLDLDAGRHRVVIDYAAIHLRAPERVRYRTRLAGLDEAWIDAAARRRAEYPGLPSGHYRFEVQATLDGERWSPSATLPISVAPFYYQRPAFYLAAAAALVAFGWLVQRQRVQALDRRARELEGMVDFGRSVAGVLDPDEVADRLEAEMARRWPGRPWLALARREKRAPVVRGWRAPTPGEAQAILEAAAAGAPAPLDAALAVYDLDARAPLASGEAVFGLLALKTERDARGRARELAELGALAAQTAMALEGAWQAQEAVRWRQVSEARVEWHELEPAARLVFATVARLGFDAPATVGAVRAELATVLGDAPGVEARLDAALERLLATGAIARGPGGELRVERAGWLLLPEIRLPLSEIARQVAPRVGGYRLAERIGAGGMGEVYRGVDVEDGTQVAVKLLYPHDAADEESRRRLEREGELVAGISHPNVVRLYGRGEHQGRLYLAMELIEGETLAARLRRSGALPFAEAVTVGRQLASALAALHARGVIHRDVNSGNIMCAPAGRFVLLDFGLARGLESTTLTRAQSIFGTLPYMSPEQLRGEALDERTDLWSLGVVLHEAATGALPWESTVTVKVALEILRAGEGAPRGFPAVGDPRLAALLSRILEPDRTRRSLTAAVLERELARLASSP